MSLFKVIFVVIVNHFHKDQHRFIAISKLSNISLKYIQLFYQVRKKVYSRKIISKINECPSIQRHFGRECLTRLKNNFML